MNYFKLFYLLLFLSYSSLVCAQNKAVEKDSTGIYNKIEDFSKKRKFTKKLHQLIFRSQKQDTKPAIDLRKRTNQTVYDGKIIRKINIITMDPFGKTVSDTLKTPNNWLERTGNFLHIKTKEGTIRNLLLFKENQPLDTLLIQESERLVRSNNYVRKTEIRTELVSKTSDSVDVTVMVLDSWSLIPDASISSSKNTLKLRERNLLGIGHNYRFDYTTRFDDGEKAYNVVYNVPNFRNTYINTSISYFQNLDKHYTKSINITRPFYSPLTKWAGGIYVDEQFLQRSLPDASDSLVAQNFKYYSQDIWLAHSSKLFKGNSVTERTTNLVSAIRLINLDYKERPNIAYDSIQYFSNETFPLASIGISSRQYIQDEYIFNYGIIEDVPIGTIFNITGGYQHKNNQNRTYLGARVSMGNYTKWGYGSFNLEYGTFLKGTNREQITYALQLYYFTNLVALGSKWKLRQFIKPQLLIGKRRLPTSGDQISINENSDFNASGLPDFNTELYGTEKFVISLQTQLYSPWNLLGFRLNPFINITSGLIGDDNNHFYKKKLYNTFSVGFLIRNDYLVFNSFQLSLTFYPTIPQNGSNILKTNTIQSEDFGLPNFNLGKPRPVSFN